MGSLVSIFRQKNKKYTILKHENTTEWQKIKKNRVEKFLRFCESKYIKDIHQIEKKNYDMFIENLNKLGHDADHDKREDADRDRDDHDRIDHCPFDFAFERLGPFLKLG